MTGRGDSFLNFVFQSFGLHLGVVTLFTVKVLIFPTEIPLEKKSIRIDIVALPAKKNKVLKKAEKPIQSGKQALQKKDPPPLKKKEKKFLLKKKKEKKNSKEDLKSEQNLAITRLKALKNLSEKKEFIEKEKKLMNEKYKGNILNKGSSIDGLRKIRHESYLNQLDQHIRNHWKLPEWLTRTDLKARVLILIDKNGVILSQTFTLQSGNEFFDRNILKTLKKATPLPPPPASLVNFYSTKGVEFRFPE